MVEAAFYLLSLAAIAMLLALFGKYSHGKIIRPFAGWIVGWLAYLSLLDYSDILKNFDLPPRIPLLVVIPAIILIVVIAKRKPMVVLLEAIPLHWAVFLQSFRIFVELLIYATFLEGIFPQRATFQGLNYDIVVGISALPMGLLVMKGIITNRGILVWNMVSLGILSLTVYSFISTYYFSDYPLTNDTMKFVELPYLLLASVLLPTAIFLHVFSIRQVLNNSR